MRLHCVPLPAPGPPRTKTTLGPKSTCTMSRFLELHRFAEKDDSCPKKVGVSIWGFGKKRRKRSLVARILLFWHCELVKGEIQLSMILRAMDWKTQETNKPKRIEHHGLKSEVNLDLENIRVANFEKHWSMSKYRLLPFSTNTIAFMHPWAACTSLQTASACCSASILWKRLLGIVFWFQWKKQKPGQTFFREGNRSQLAHAKQKAWPQVWYLVIFQWKSESPWKTQCGEKRATKKKTSLGTKQNNHQPKKIGKAFTPSHATLLLKMLHHWHGFLTGFVSKQGFVDWFFHDFPCCPNPPTVLYVWRTKSSLYRSVTFLPNQWPPARSHIL